MDLKLKSIDDSKRELEAYVSYEELKPHFEKAIANYRKKADIPGFRKGKAPLNMIKKLYGEEIEYSAIEDIVNDIFREYVVDNKLDVLGKGEIKDMDFKPKESLKFFVEFEVMPEINLEEYKGIELKKTKYVIEDSLVDDEIEYHSMRNATFEIDGTASDDQYIVTVDLQNLDDAGNIIIGQSQKDLRVYLGNKKVYPEFREGLKGIKEGEVRVIDSKNAEGGPKKVQITCTKVEKIILPEMNEEFFKKITGKEDVHNMEEFKGAIRGELEKIYGDIASRNLHNDTISEMVKLNQFNAPDRYVNIILEGMLEDFKRQYSEKLPENFSDENFRKERRVDAIFSAKWFLIREKIIEQEDIKVTVDDYRKLAEENHSRYNIPVEKLQQAYEQNEEVASKLLTDKVLELIISNAKIEEIEDHRKKDDYDDETE